MAEPSVTIQKASPNAARGSSLESRYSMVELPQVIQELPQLSPALPVDRWDSRKENLESFLGRGGNPNAETEKKLPIIVHLARYGDFPSLKFLLAGRKDLPPGKTSQEPLRVGTSDKNERRTALMEVARNYFNYRDDDVVRMMDLILLTMRVEGQKIYNRSPLPPEDKIPVEESVQSYVDMQDKRGHRALTETVLALEYPKSFDFLIAQGAKPFDRTTWKIADEILKTNNKRLEEFKDEETPREEPDSIQEARRLAGLAQRMLDVMEERAEKTAVTA